MNSYNNSHKLNLKVVGYLKNKQIDIFLQIPCIWFASVLCCKHGLQMSPEFQNNLLIFSLFWYFLKDAYVYYTLENGILFFNQKNNVYMFVTLPLWDVGYEINQVPF